MADIEVYIAAEPGSSDSIRPRHPTPSNLHGGSSFVPEKYPARSKRNVDFHALFPDVPATDLLIEDYGCALQGVIPIQGRLYITEDYLGFYANISGWVTTFHIPFSDIVKIGNNATQLATSNATQTPRSGSKLTFTSFLSHDVAFNSITKVWQLTHPSPPDVTNLEAGISILGILYESDGGLEDELGSDDEESASDEEPASGKESAPDEVAFCPCSAKPQHYPSTVADFVVPGTLKKIFELIFASSFMVGFLTGNQQVTDLQMSSWPINSHGSPRPARSVSYSRPIEQGAKWIKCYLTEEVTHGNDSHWAGVLATTTPNTRNESPFVVKTRTCITPAGDLGTRVVVTTGVEWRGTSSVKGITEYSAISGQKSYYTDLEKAIRSYIADNPNEFPSEASPSDVNSARPLAKILLDDQNAHLVELPNNPPIASGGFCELYLGFYRPTELKLALKRPKDLFPTEDELRRFRREAEIWSTCDHNHILPFLGTLEVEKRLYLASPWMALGDLLAFVQSREQYIKDGRLSETFVDPSIHPAYSAFKETNAAREVAEGLAYLHSRDIVHGDLKANNVLLDDKCCVKICDFGLTKSLVHNVTSTARKGVGSSRWQSPELAHNKPKSPQSDVYAFALTVVEVLTANYPFPHLNELVAVIMAVVFKNERPAREPTSRLGVDFFLLWEVVAQCWAAEPENRPSMEVVLLQLRP